MYVPCFLLLASAFKAALSSLFFVLGNSLLSFFFLLLFLFKFLFLQSLNTFRYSQCVNIVPADFPCLVGNLLQLVRNLLIVVLQGSGTEDVVGMLESEVAGFVGSLFVKLLSRETAGCFTILLVRTGAGLYRGIYDIPVRSTRLLGLNLEKLSSSIGKEITFLSKGQSL